MKKIFIWTACGLGLATASGLAEMPHLSASLVVLTVFCATPAALIVLMSAPSIVVKAST
jgi:hypothetical protein